MPPIETNLVKGNKKFCIYFNSNFACRYLGQSPTFLTDFLFLAKEQEAFDKEFGNYGKYFFSNFGYWIPFCSYLVGNNEFKNLEFTFEYSIKPKSGQKTSYESLYDKNILNYRARDTVPQRLKATYNFFDKKAFGLSDGAAIPDECSSFVFEDMQQAEHA